MKKVLIPLVALTILFIGCTKTDLNEEANNELEGSWEVLSKIVDGEEWIDIYSSYEFIFEKTGPVKGKLHEIYTNQNGPSEGIVTYRVEDDGTKVITDVPVTYNINFDGNTLEFDGTFYGSTYEFLLNKK